MSKTKQVTKTLKNIVFNDYINDILQSSVRDITRDSEFLSFETYYEYKENKLVIYIKMNLDPSHQNASELVAEIVKYRVRGMLYCPSLEKATTIAEQDNADFKAYPDLPGLMSFFKFWSYTWDTLENIIISSLEEKLKDYSFTKDEIRKAIVFRLSDSIPLTVNFPTKDGNTNPFAAEDYITAWNYVNKETE